MYICPIYLKIFEKVESFKSTCTRYVIENGNVLYNDIIDSEVEFIEFHCYHRKEHRNYNEFKIHIFRDKKIIEIPEEFRGEEKEILNRNPEFKNFKIKFYEPF